MNQEKRRFTISLPQNMELELTEARRHRYPNDTQEEMLRDLILRGLRVWRLQSGKSL